MVLGRRSAFLLGQFYPILRGEVLNFEHYWEGRQPKLYPRSLIKIHSGEFFSNSDAIRCCELEEGNPLKSLEPRANNGFPKPWLVFTYTQFNNLTWILILKIFMIFSSFRRILKNVHRFWLASTLDADSKRSTSRKTNITMENQPFEDVSPIENGDVPLPC